MSGKKETVGFCIDRQRGKHNSVVSSYSPESLYQNKGDNYEIIKCKHKCYIILFESY